MKQIYSQYTIRIPFTFMHIYIILSFNFYCRHELGQYGSIPEVRTPCPNFGHLPGLSKLNINIYTGNIILQQFAMNFQVLKLFQLSNSIFFVTCLHHQQTLRSIISSPIIPFLGHVICPNLGHFMCPNFGHAMCPNFGQATLLVLTRAVDPDLRSHEYGFNKVKQLFLLYAGYPVSSMWQIKPDIRQINRISNNLNRIFVKLNRISGKLPRYPTGFRMEKSRISVSTLLVWA